MNHTFRPCLEQLEHVAAPASVNPLTLPDDVELSGTGAVVTEAVGALTYGVALAFLVADHWQDNHGPESGGVNG
jgi:hypothetical protein